MPEANQREDVHTANNEWLREMFIKKHPKDEAVDEVEQSSLAREVRLMESRHDRMKDLLNEIVATFGLPKNRDELHIAGSTGVAMIQVADLWKQKFERIIPPPTFPNAVALTKP